MKKSIMGIALGGTAAAAGIAITIISIVGLAKKRRKEHKNERY